MSISGDIIDSKAFLKNNPRADRIFRLLRNKEKHGAFFWWVLKEASCSPEEVTEGLRELKEAGLIEEIVGSAYDPVDKYYELTRLADQIRQVYI
jgi:DNA-binding HxlR family transcriptional regulator